MGMVALNILNTESWTAAKRLSSSLENGAVLITPHCETNVVRNRAEGIGLGHLVCEIPHCLNWPNFFPFPELPYCLGNFTKFTRSALYVVGSIPKCSVY